ncbi:MAG: SRPBCC domain-containing protein [Actinomycetota bacterium]
MADRRTSVRRVIDAPANTVWALLTDASSYDDWNPTVMDITGTIAEGERIELTSVISPKRAFKLAVSDVVAGERMVWSDGMPLGLFRGVRTFVLAPADGRTEFSMVEEFSGPLAGLICRTIPDLTESFDQFADGLKTAAEAGG